MKRTALTDEERSNLQVKLKPFLGMDPKKYLPILYGLGLMVLLFFIFLFPGIHKNGTVYTIKTTPQNASVLIDNSRLGPSNLKAFVPKGDHTLTISTPYSEVYTQKIQTKGRLFGSLFFPRKESLTISLSSGVNQKSLQKTFTQTSQWYQGDQDYKLYPLPPLSRELSRSLYQSKDSFGTDRYTPLFSPYLRALLESVDSNSGLNDWFYAKNLSQTKGAVLSMGNLITILDSADKFIKENPRLLEGISQFSSSNLEAFTIDTQGRKPLAKRLNRPNISLLDSSVKMIPFIVEGEPIYLADRETSQGLFAQFIKENPHWGADKKETLIKEGLVDQNYLKDLDLKSPSLQWEKPLNFISYYGALAFCDWLNKVAPVKGYSYGLPSESQWLAVAYLNNQDSKDRPSQKRTGLLFAETLPKGDADLYDMDGNLWEWTSTAYGALSPYLSPSPSETNLYKEAFSEALVKGGSWANGPGEVSVETRGSQVKNWCTPFIGFRLSLSPIKIIEE